MMARRKEKTPVDMGQAFLDRCDRELRKLKQSLTKQLHTDIARLLDEELHSDLTLKGRTYEFQLHKFVLHARSRRIFEQIKEISCHVDNVWTVPDWLTQDSISSVIRQLYGVLLEDTGGLDTEPTFDLSTEDYLLSLLQEPKDLMCDVNLTVENRDVDVNTDDTVHNGPCVNGVPDENKVSSKDDQIINHEIQTDVVKETIETSSSEEGNVENKSIVKPNGCEMHNGTYKENNDVDSGENITPDVSLPDLIKMTYDITVPYDTCCKLGEDLLRGFLQDLDYDCVIEVSGVHFKAHKCILSARSCYFEAMLSGSWRESETEEIKLEGISPAAMEQTLLYLYGGVTGVNPECSIGELMMVSDMYGLEDFRDVVFFHMKKAYCHFFHKPCTECEIRVPEALTYSVMFNMEELRDRCIKWINGHKIKTWHTKSFANLPADVMDICLQSAIAEISISNVLETMLDCQKMLRTIPRLKWCEPTLHSVTTLMDKAVEYTSKHFTRLLKSPKFYEIDKSLAHKMGLLEELLDTVIDSLPTDGACQVFMNLSDQLAMSQAPKEITLWSNEFCEFVQSLYKKSESFMTRHIHQEFCEFVQSLYKKSESFMTRHIHQVVRSAGWKKLPKSSQTHLLNTANFVCVDSTGKNRVPLPKLSSLQRTKGEGSSQKRLAAKSCSSKEERERKNNTKGVKSNTPKSTETSQSNKPTSANQNAQVVEMDEALESYPSSDNLDDLCTYSGTGAYHQIYPENYQEILDSFTLPEPVHCTIQLLPILKWNCYKPD